MRHDRARTSRMTRRERAILWTLRIIWRVRGLIFGVPEAWRRD